MTDVPKTPLQKLYEATERSAGVPLAIRDLDRLKAEGKELPAGKFELIYKDFGFTQATKSKTLGEHLAGQVRGLIWGALEINKKTESVRVHLWKPVTAPLSNVLSGKQLCKWFAAEMRKLAEEFVPIEAKEFKVLLMHRSEAELEKENLPPAQTRPDNKEAVEWIALSHGPQETADNAAHLRMNYRREVRLMVQAALSSKCAEIYLVVGIKQGLMTDKKTRIFEYAISFRYKGDAPDFMNVPFSKEEDADHELSMRQERAASSPFV